jgi:hypothetical protein
MKRILFLLFALIGGPVLVVCGIRDYQNSKKLMAQGKPISGKVVDAIETVSRRSRIHHYYLVVRFQPEGGELVQKKASVSKSLFDAGIATQSAPVTYLPSDPKIFQVGDKAHTDTSGLTAGILLSVGGLGFLAFLVFTRRSSNEITTLDDSNQAPELKNAA